MRANEHLIGLETGFISIFRAWRKLRMCVVYVYVRKQTFDWLGYWLHLDISSFEKSENVCSVRMYRYVYTC